MKIYTKTGDNGTTSLYGGKRTPKYDSRIEAYGTIDELNSHIGLLRDQEIVKTYQYDLIKIQNILFEIGANLATPNNTKKQKLPTLDNSIITFLEDSIDKMNSSLPEMTHFILPGGHTTVSYCHIARCICRRAERLSVYLDHKEGVNKDILIFLNRLSDYLFVLARKLSSDNNIDEIPWNTSKKI